MSMCCKRASSLQTGPLSITLDNTGTEHGEAVAHLAQRVLVGFIRTRTSSPGKLVVEKLYFCCRFPIIKKLTTQKKKNHPNTQEARKVHVIYLEALTQNLFYISAFMTETAVKGLTVKERKCHLLYDGPASRDIKVCIDILILYGMAQVSSTARQRLAEAKLK